MATRCASSSHSSSTRFVVRELFDARLNAARLQPLFEVRRTLAGRGQRSLVRCRLRRCDVLDRRALDLGGAIDDDRSSGRPRSSAGQRADLRGCLRSAPGTRSPVSRKPRLFATTRSPRSEDVERSKIRGERRATCSPESCDCNATIAVVAVPIVNNSGSRGLRSAACESSCGVPGISPHAHSENSERTRDHSGPDVRIRSAICAVVSCEVWPCLSPPPIPASKRSARVAAPAWRYGAAAASSDGTWNLPPVPTSIVAFCQVAAWQVVQPTLAASSNSALPRAIAAASPGDAGISGIALTHAWFARS